MTFNNQARDESFTVTITTEPDRIVVAPHGALDSGTVPTFRTEVAPHLPTRQAITVDLTHTNVLASAGLDAILELTTHTRTLDLHCPHPWQQQLADITGLTHLVRREP